MISIYQCPRPPESDKESDKKSDKESDTSNKERAVKSNSTYVSSNLLCCNPNKYPNKSDKEDQPMMLQQWQRI